MLNKILIFGGLALSAILIIENMVSGLQAYVFISSGATAWFLSLLSTLIGIGIGFGLKGFISGTRKEEDDNLDF